MTLISSFTVVFFSALFAVTFSSCGTFSSPNTPEPKPNQTGEAVNPHPKGSYAAFKWNNYPGTTRAWKNEALLEKANSSNSTVKIDIGDQRGFLMVGNEVAMDYRVSTGRRGKHDTPTGKYHIIEKSKDKRSNLYGKIFDAEGTLVEDNADSRKDEIPLGGKFVGSPMAYWMRLTNDGIGMHKGDVNSRYASHGCIRSHSAAIPIVFEKTGVGTSVLVQP